MAGRVKFRCSALFRPPIAIYPCPISAYSGFEVPILKIAIVVLAYNTIIVSVCSDQTRDQATLLTFV